MAFATKATAMEVVKSIFPAYESIPAATIATIPPPKEYKKSIIYPYVDNEFIISSNLSTLSNL